MRILGFLHLRRLVAALFLIGSVGLTAGCGEQAAAPAGGGGGASGAAGQEAERAAREKAYGAGKTIARVRRVTLQRHPRQNNRRLAGFNRSDSRKKRGKGNAATWARSLLRSSL